VAAAMSVTPFVVLSRDVGEMCGGANLFRLTDRSDFKRVRHHGQPKWQLCSLKPPNKQSLCRAIQNATQDIDSKELTPKMPLASSSQKLTRDSPPRWHTRQNCQLHALRAAAGRNASVQRDFWGSPERSFPTLGPSPPPLTAAPQQSRSDESR
jgi:hypothetical protein